MTPRTGFLLALEDDLDTVKTAEALGYESLWAAEGQGKSAFGKLERWATVTESIGLATGIVNIFARTPATTASAIATLDDHSDGRAILGLGVAHPGVVEGFHGAKFEKPLPRMHEYIELIRRYLNGDVSGYDGRFFSPTRTAFWDAFEPLRSDIPIYNGALGPGNVRLTGEFADGWVPNLYPIDRFETALEWLETGLDRGGRTRDDIDVAMYILTAVDEDSTVAHQAAAHHIAYYMRVIPGYYERVARKAGLDETVDDILAAPTFDAAVTAVSQEFIDLVAITGTPETAVEQLNQYRRAGVDLPIVRAPSGCSDEMRDTVLQTFAPES
ncbi:LLM class flavin-dependent oxidoreductase [Natronocalculus amylovorans]|uniref:LLM class flavin-dependent oxidoreductase n=1 Tax=Natronocalculus amylovorans TaxID=2917812 RepID=A0AAE3FZ46_9EURY|nr:LLM class flavin-dependent oxidoreductase [Natronocalculus amylovorans]MCL9818237.1 LLM class flavin-dependent oxidoreductase [Natronocalculus amylovorans]